MYSYTCSPVENIFVLETHEQIGKHCICNKNHDGGYKKIKCFCFPTIVQHFQRFCNKVSKFFS